MPALGNTHFNLNKSEVGPGRTAERPWQVVFVSGILSDDRDAKCMNIEGMCVLRRRK